MSELNPKRMARVFISYSRADAEHLTALEKHLAPLKRQKLAALWTDRELLPGQAWELALLDALRTADVVILLVSPDFMASDFIHDVELKEAFARHARGEVRIIPVLVRPTNVKGDRLDTLQGLPKDRKPISTYQDRDLAWLEVVTGLMTVLENLPAKPVPGVHQADALRLYTYLPSSDPSAENALLRALAQLDPTQRSSISRCSWTHTWPGERPTLGPEDVIIAILSERDMAEELLPKVRAELRRLLEEAKKADGVGLAILFRGMEAGSRDRQVLRRHLELVELHEQLATPLAELCESTGALEAHLRDVLQNLVTRAQAARTRRMDSTATTSPETKGVVPGAPEAAGRSIPEAALDHYLTATLSQHANIPLIGVNPELKLTLGIDDVYVPLRDQIHRGLYHEEKWHAKHSVPLADERGMESTDIDLVEAFKCASGKRGVVILGDPGSGKTTLLKLLLVRCIRDGAESLGLPRDVVPVMLPLRDLKGDKNLDDFFQRSLSEKPHLTLPPGFARALREARPLLYLLDGLDEIPDETERASVSRWILSALQTHTNAFFAVTSRYAGYQGEARLDDHFAELNVRPLREPEAFALVENFYRIVEKAQPGDNDASQVSAKAKSAHLQTLLASDQHRTRRMRELQSNPLLLTILCLVHQRLNTLPDERWRLYEQCLDTLLYHWQKAKDLTLPFKKLETARRLLLPLAYWLHQVDKRRHATADEVVAALAEPLTQFSVTPAAMRQFLKDVRDRSGLLVGWGTDSYGFIHLALQEYLTAIELKNRGYGKLELLDEAARHFGESWWTEVILLLVSLREPSMFEPFMRRVVMRDAFAQLENRALLADCVADASVKSPLPFLEVVTDPNRTDDTKLAALWALRGIKEEQKARVIEVCRTLVESPNPQLRAQVRELLEARGETVATRPSLELEAGTIWIHPATGLEFVYVPAGGFRMGSNRQANEKPIHMVTFKRGFWIGKYPVTNAQYGRFLANAKDAREPDHWMDSQFNGAEQPVVGVTWFDAKAYCEWANGVLRGEGDPPPAGGNMIVLPSEAEWEYAARGPKAREYPWGSEAPTPLLANFDSNVGRTTPVGQYPKGASWVGALDMAGNVWEWCEDLWHENYVGAPNNGSLWRAGGNNDRRVLRGGGWSYDAGRVHSACRGRWSPREGGLLRGFRVLAAALPDGDSRAVNT